ncbi:acyl-ACP--UDP-N-acetylglucosamine O-acyltransferase [Brevundimonas sp. 2R-24]|uniref:Acyl-ACP--UDP-N-acetylglucosamine O-acyltransferase n=1 Tax=Peiella sedimenti TaxID=3061083 RepID=A0ABT8SQG0_9CAUL|nr:acyl-ACP--UDP-N-acetylglucosamine O-acyltransferase [Caulobacteraceae bacterium XZ-24]
MTIHPTALVDPGAEIGDGAVVGPWCRVEAGARLAAGVELASSVVVHSHTDIGEGTVVHPFAVLGGAPQHGGYKGEPTRLVIGARNIIREHATLHRGTVQGGGLTRVGEGCLFMVGAHIAHDCMVGDGVTFANNAVIGGHVQVGDGAFLGGQSAVHQWCRVGKGAILGGGAVATRDVIPFGSAWGNHARLEGLNMVGLKRRGFDKARIRRMLKLFDALFHGEGLFEDRLARAEAEYADLDEAREIITFIRDGGSRPLCRP